MNVRVYIANVSPLRDEALFRRVYGIMPEYRRVKTDRVIPSEQKRLSLAAGFLLKRSCEDAGIPGADERIVLSQYGKPELACGGVYFSLSHSGESAMCAISSVPVGCDVEIIKPVGDNLAVTALSPEEYELFTLTPTEARPRLFTRMWTMKEAFMKADGRGLGIGARNIRTRFDSFACSVSCEGRCFPAAELLSEDGYCRSICLLDASGEKPDIVTVNIEII